MDPPALPRRLPINRCIGKLREGVARGTRIRISRDIVGKTAPDWVADDVSHDAGNRVAIAQDVVVVALLPEPLTRSLLPRERRSKLPVVHHSSKVGIFGKALEKQVHMIAHHAEGNNRKPPGLEGRRNLQRQPRRGSLIGEARSTLVGADRDEILMQTDIRESGEARSAVRGHATATSRTRPVGRRV